MRRDKKVSHHAADIAWNRGVTLAAVRVLEGSTGNKFDERLLAHKLAFLLEM